ncbi:hypothetical protein RJT34_15836 [Clitoria ternatea]|uniref:Uncharacterized protein n=1 Tax=Clitoria ternatea TaxID=43366 RepID=A0AAN9J664_CLITE
MDYLRVTRPAQDIWSVLYVSLAVTTGILEAGWGESVGKDNLILPENHSSVVWSFEASIKFAVLHMGIFQ